MRCYLLRLIQKAFKRLHYPVDIIAPCVRGYLAYALSLRHLEEMMAKRGIAVDHATLSRWVHRGVPRLVRRYRRIMPMVGCRWRRDETDINIKGQWRYLYRAVDPAGNTVDFLLTARRDAAAALRFFRKSIHQQGRPTVVTLDKSRANKAAVDKLNTDMPKQNRINIRQSQYLNNLIEQGPRRIKRRIRPMLGLKRFRRAQTLLSGIEVLCMLSKGQYLQPPRKFLLPTEPFYRLAV